MKSGGNEAKYCSDTAQIIDYCDGEQTIKQTNKPKTQLLMLKSCCLLNGALWWSLIVNADIFAAQPGKHFLFLDISACPGVRNGSRPVP